MYLYMRLQCCYLYILVYVLFYCILLYCISQTLHFLQIEGSGYPALNKCIGSIFPIEFAHFMLLSLFDNFCNISNFFIIIVFVMVICDQ